MRRLAGMALVMAAVISTVFVSAASAQEFDFEFGKTGGGSGDGELAANARGIAVDADGNPWVADTDNHRIVKYDYNGNFIAAFTAPLGGGPAFTQPEAIAADASGFLYIVQGGADNQIVKIDTGGTFVRTIGPSGWKGAAMIDPQAIWVDSATGKLYVAEASQITIFDANGVATGAIPRG
jgi:streptogramin lyase